MQISYDKLWKLMKANKIKKSNLSKAANITQYTMTQLNKNAPVNMKTMMDICTLFHCDIGDVMEFIDENIG